MRVLVVGAAGYVGSIIVPALAARHECRYLDLRPVPGREAESVVGDLHDPKVVERAVAGMDAVVYSALGVPKPGATMQAIKDVSDIDSGFRVNAAGTYRVFAAALAAGARRLVYASTMNVFAAFRAIPFIHDD